LQFQNKLQHFGLAAITAGDISRQQFEIRAISVAVAQIKKFTVLKFKTRHFFFLKIFESL